MSDKIHLSASKISCFNTCSWQFWCKYIKKLPDQSSAGAILGSATHEIAQSLLHNKQTVISKQLLDNTIKKYKLSGKEDDIKGFIDVALANDFFCKGCIELHSEYKFQLTGKNYEATGFIDKLAIYKQTNSAKVIDYKTSKLKYTRAELEFNLQWLMYSKAVFDIFKLIPEVEFQFLKFSRKPIITMPKCTASQLLGFESYLEYIAGLVNKFKEQDKTSIMACNDNEKRWICDRMCSYNKPYDYYILFDANGTIKTMSVDPIVGINTDKVVLQENPKASDVARNRNVTCNANLGEKVIKEHYAGCIGYK